jgi:D-alanine transfer protein
MKRSLPHLIPAGVAILILVGVLIGGNYYANSLENLYIHALTPKLLTQIDAGSALQRAALRQPDLLMIYGSSEMLSRTSVKTPYFAQTFFSQYPTGFQAFEVAVSGATSLDIAQNLATLGPALKGKKVVISFTPSMFLYPEVKEDAYAHDFSVLHADGFIFSPYISMNIKRQVANRMLAYPTTLGKDPVLLYAAQNLVKNSLLNDLVYYLALPAGQLNLMVINLQDHWEVLNYIWANPKLTPTVTHKPAVINWQAAINKAEAEQKIASSNNPYGFENSDWTKRYGNFQAKKPGSLDQTRLGEFTNSKEWGDLQLLLEVANELGAQVLLLGRPINGTFFEATGVSSQVDDYFYNRLEQTASAAQIALVDYKDHDTDRYFSIDEASHTSRKGWVYVDQTLDAFFHDNLH